MRTYSEEQKRELIEKMLAPQSTAVPALSRETGIPKDTLYMWRRQALRERGLMGKAQSSPERWSSEQKFAMVLETASLSEADRNAYCRRQGVYPEQLQRWRQACEQANTRSRAAGAPDAQLRQQMRQLQSELARKEKALAETAALLVLRKKAQAIWGENEDA